MLIRELRRLILVVAPLVLLVYTVFRYSDTIVSYSQPESWGDRTLVISNILPEDQDQQAIKNQEDPQRGEFESNEGLPEVLSSHNNNDNNAGDYSIDTHLELYSVSTLDGKYFKIKFGDKPVINPNIIPHPLLEDTWIIVAQEHDPTDDMHTHFVELACDATFAEFGNELSCLPHPIELPIAPTGPGKCEGDIAYMGLNVGPHDARIFYGPQKPFAVYGSNSRETCFGQWIQDFSVLMNWGSGAQFLDADIQEQEQDDLFQLGTELHRPPPVFPIEKNWFLFWDPDGQIYAHYEIAPRRVFAQLGADGSAGLDLASFAAAAGDEACMEKHMPEAILENEFIHQATNSLSITLCRQSDPVCQPSDTNTFLFTIFQHKTFQNFHSVYEPYVMVFRRRPPFEVYGISRKPLWIHGRDERSRMFYVTAISWRGRGKKYHGYIDDVMFLSFGIEDRETAGIDILASDLLVGLGLCSEGQGSLLS
ncbi:hypothetical protein F5Y04DRAFT_86270 [Hypomontagnella monticulosa]|nr:hypothetical protein F5Y04DRAFT_86270 [Hypomontagnella monticulosa]